MSVKSKRIPKSFKLNPIVAGLVEKASDDARVSEGELIDACVIQNIESVVRKIVLRNEAMKDPAAYTEFLRFVRQIQSERELTPNRVSSAPAHSKKPVSISSASTGRTLTKYTPKGKADDSND